MFYIISKMKKVLPNLILIFLIIGSAYIDLAINSPPLSSIYLQLISMKCKSSKNLLCLIASVIM